MNKIEKFIGKIRRRWVIIFVINPVCQHEYWGQCGFINMGRCYECGDNFYYK